MNFFLTWISTTVVSFILTYKHEFKMFKEIADAGYKLSIDKNRNNSDNADDVEYNSSLISLFIPFYNLFTVIEREIVYEKEKDVILEQMIFCGMVEEMSEYEKKIYSENPTGLNALLISYNKHEKSFQKVNNNTKLNEEYLIKIIVQEDNLQTNIIKAKIVKINDEISFKVLEVDGPIKDLHYFKLVEYISDIMIKINLDENVNYNTNNEYVEINIINKKPKTKLERYVELRDSLKQNGYLYGEEMFEYHDLEKELGPTLTLTK